ncbi:MAG: class I mannose-6-phosphate isomerase [Candidatus Cryptobacteroides sp.]
MEEKRQLYPLKFVPQQAEEMWGEEVWTLADLGFVDSAVAEGGWLEGNSVSDLMETYLERIVGEDIYQWYGRQFPLSVKFLNINGSIPLTVHPDDEIAAQRYDALGKRETWYILEADPKAVIRMGFNKDISVREFYGRCLDGTVDEVLNTIHPKAGDFIDILPGTVHSASGKMRIAVVQESSELNLKLCPQDGATSGADGDPLMLEEAIDFIDYRKYDGTGYHPADSHANEAVTRLVQGREFTVNEMHINDALRISTEKFGRFIIYTCISGEVSIQTVSTDGKKGGSTRECRLKSGETVLIPADMPDFLIVPVEKGPVLLEAMVEECEQTDDYINPDSEPFLEGEDYEGLDTDDPQADE